MAWLGNWSKRIKLTIDHGDIDDALSDFPILVYLSTSSGRNSKDVSAVFDELTEDANRKKIAVTTSNGQTQCYVEIEKWDDANEQAWLWVKVPSIASGVDTVLYLYYDVNHADNTDYVGDPNSVPAENVWDDNFKLVCHMRDDPDNEHVRDSTSNNHDGTKKAANEPIEADGKIGKAQSLDSLDDFIDFGAAGNLALPSVFTYEFWLKTPTNGKNIYNTGSGTNQRNSLDLNIYANKLRITKHQVGHILSSATSITTNTWGLWTITRDAGDDWCIYLNDGLNATVNNALTIGAFSSIYLGRGPYGYFNGLMDEIRISDIDRTPAWIKASYESETDDLLAFGSEERELPLVICIGGCEYPLVYGV